MKEGEYCPVTESTRIIGDHWNILIVRELLDGCKRFSDLEEEVPSITKSTLSARLKQLVDSKIVERKQYDCMPPKVEYTLTKKGADLSKVIAELELFAKKYY